MTEKKPTLDYGRPGRGKTRRAAALIAVTAAALLAVTGWVIWRYAGESLGLRAPAVPAGGSLSALFPPGYAEKVQKITALLESAPTSRPSAADSNELLKEAAHDSDFRIRVRAMAVLPFISERERAVDVLIAAVHERNPRTNGGGNVPLYATTYLADMKATRAIPDIADWLRFLGHDQSFDQQLKPGVLRKVREDLARLEAAETQPAAAGEQPQ